MRRWIRRRRIRTHLRVISWFALILLYLALTSYQLGLPGLHYDEAREAGLNAMEILTGAPTTTFRATGPILFGRQWPLMVQDYIGALNVYLSLPFLWLTGIGVPNLRLLATLIGLVTLLLVERTIGEWQQLHGPRPLDKPHAATGKYTIGIFTSTGGPAAISVAGLLALGLLVASPTFVFWSRQGLFVTNLTEPLTFGCIWQGLRWLRCGRPRHLLWSAFLGGSALYAKLLAIWIVGPFGLMVAGWWLWRRQRPRLPVSLWIAMSALFVLPLMPLLWFNLQSGGTVRAITGNLAKSYYGVDNSAVWANLATRGLQFRQVMEGDHLWYLGGLYENPIAFWVGSVVVLIALWQRPRLLVPPLLLLLAALATSLFTISDLFITHYALLQPLAIGVIGLALYTAFWTTPRPAWLRHLGLLLVLLWTLLDLTATLRYHGALTRSGGLADHSDASYHLAYYLRYNGLGAPLALDWGVDAPVRYLSEGTVTPLEIFGYDSPQAPAADFAIHLQPFLDNPANVYLLHVPQATVFAGRREIFMALVAERGLSAELDATFSQRDGTPLYELWRVERTK